MNAKQVAEQLAAVGTMTAGIAHEIRNPLNGAGLQLTVLERRVRKLAGELQPPLLEPLLLVRKEIRRLDRLVKDFLLVARPITVVVQAVDLHELVAAIVDLLREDADRRGVKLTSEVSRGLAKAAGDPEQLSQMVINLVLNALEAARDGGTVCISSSSGAEELFIAIDDSGSGIEPADRERVFEAFFTSKPSGSGLGLSIVHNIVARHGGRIAIEESKLGGARFTVHLRKQEAA